MASFGIVEPMPYQALQCIIRLHEALPGPVMLSKAVCFKAYIILIGSEKSKLFVFSGDNENGRAWERTQAHKSENPKAEMQVYTGGCQAENSTSQSRPIRKHKTVKAATSPS